MGVSLGEAGRGGGWDDATRVRDLHSSLSLIRGESHPSKHSPHVHESFESDIGGGQNDGDERESQKGASRAACYGVRGQGCLQTETATRRVFVKRSFASKVTMKLKAQSYQDFNSQMMPQRSPAAVRYGMIKDLERHYIYLEFLEATSTRKVSTVPPVTNGRTYPPNIPLPTAE